jgi:predicted amidohydrolase
MRIGACQTPEILGDTDRAIDLIREFAREPVDLLLFPECFLQGYLVTADHVHRHAHRLDSPDFAAVLGRLADLRPTLVLGLIERDGAHYHNTAAVISRGRVVGRYRKTFLTRGESIFTPGTTYPVFGDDVRFGVNICYDTRFPEAAAAVAAGGAQVLLVPAQNMMRRAKAPRWEPLHHEIRARRARETGLWLISADVTGARAGTHLGLGPTSVLDPAGEVVAQVPTGTTGLVTVDIARNDNGG